MWKIYFVRTPGASPLIVQDRLPMQQNVIGRQDSTLSFAFDAAAADDEARRGLRARMMAARPHMGPINLYAIIEAPSGELHILTEEDV